MLSTEDVKRFVENSRHELEKEKRKLTAQNGCRREKIHEDSVASNSEKGITTKECPRVDRSQCENRSSRSAPVVRRSVSTSPLRRKGYKDYSQELKIQIYPSDDEGGGLLADDASHTGLLDTVSRINEGSAAGGSLSARTTSDDIRKYCLNKLGGMLRTGEFSPNHPEMGLNGAVPRARGDVFVGLGLYEERRRELMARRKREYREYLAKQKSLNAIAKEKERLTMERNNNLYESRQQNVHYQDPTDYKHHRGSVMHNVEVSPGYGEDGEKYESTNRQHLQSFLSPAGGWKPEDARDVRPRRPSSIAVQTEDDLLHLEQRQTSTFLTPAERELSPHPSYNAKSTSQSLQQMQANSRLPQQNAGGQNANSDWRMLVEKVNIGTQNNLIMPPGHRDAPGKFLSPGVEYDEGREYLDAINGMNSKTLFGKDSPRARLLQDLSHTYLPSLFDEEGIRRRNMDNEKEAAAKRVSYQQELKKQIDEQHRLREERKAREKMLEEAETRRLEEQLKLLKLAHEAEMEKQKQMAIRIKKDSSELERQRLKLQHNIDNEKKALHRSKMKQNNSESDNVVRTSRSDSVTLFNNNQTDDSVAELKHSNLPFYYSAPPVEETTDADLDIMSYNLRQNNRHLGQDPPPKRVPFSTNVPDKSVFTESIPVKNYNTNDLMPDYAMHEEPAKLTYADLPKKTKQNDTKVVINRNNWSRNQKPNYEPTFLNKSITEMIDTRNLVKNSNKNRDVYEDSLPIPVLREPERDRLNNEVTAEDVNTNNPKYSDAMKHVDDKWKVPAVQKNILKNNFTEDGKQENILTQLGSIRRQLQLEQLKLDQSQMLPKRMIK